jgi:hypothetical protein
MADSPHPLHRRTSRTLQIKIFYINRTCKHNAANIQEALIQINKFWLAYFVSQAKGRIMEELKIVIDKFLNSFPKNEYSFCYFLHPRDMLVIFYESNNEVSNMKIFSPLFHDERPVD